MNLIKISEGSHSTVFQNPDGTTVTKIISDVDIADREIKFLNIIATRKLKNVLLPLSINYNQRSIVLPKLTPLSWLPFTSLSIKNKIYIVKQLINGLNEIHNLNIIHNDFKLDNIMYDPNTLTVKIIDFSTSLFCNEQACISGGTTPLYECPESNKSIKSDIWSLGICILKLFNVPDDIIRNLRSMSKLTIDQVIKNHFKNTKNMILIKFARLCLHPYPEKRFLLHNFI